MNVASIKVSEHRKADHEILPVFTQRWSPRAMTGEAVSKAEVMRLLEAARWAPSAFNEQPWRYVYGLKGTPAFDQLLSFLVEANQAWCRNAGALLLVSSSQNFSRNGKPNGVATFDTGSSWQSLALQGASMGLVVHGMAGFDGAKARAGLKIPDAFKTEAMIAVGRPGEVESLPPDYQKIEVPSGRKKVEEFAREGAFPG